MKFLITCFFLSLATLVAAQNQKVEIYVSDPGSFNNGFLSRIVKFDENGLSQGVYIDEQMSRPQDILFLEDSNLVLVSNFSGGTITRHNLATGAYINDFATSLSQPTRIKIGPDSLLYVLQWSGNSLVLRYNLDGSFVDQFTSVAVPQSIGMDWDADGNLYVSSYNGDIVNKFDTAGNDLGVFIDTQLQGPTNIWFDDDGTLLVADYDGTAVKRFDTDGQYLGDFMTGLSGAEGVAFMPNGNILIGNGGTSSVKAYDSTGQYIEDIIAPGAANLVRPNAVVLRVIEVSTVSIKELESRTLPFLSSTIGTRFEVNAEYADRIQQLDVYNTSGQLIEQTDSSSWKADSTADGVYIVVARFKDGNFYSQRVVVQQE